MKLPASRCSVSNEKLKDGGVIAIDLKSLEAISSTIARVYHDASCRIINVADCFGIKLLAMTGQGDPG